MEQEDEEEVEDEVAAETMFEIISCLRLFVDPPLRTGVSTATAFAVNCGSDATTVGCSCLTSEVRGEDDDAGWRIE